MKKSNILIAVFAATLATASVATATEIDFDGRTAGALRSINFGVANAAVDLETPEIPAPARDSREIQDLDINSLSGEELTKLDHRLDSSIRTAIDYCDKNRLNDIRNNFSALLTKGTIKEKYNFVNNHANKYVFQNMPPLRAAIPNALSAQQKGGIPVCLSWGTQKVCVKRETKEKICTAATLVCVAGSIASSGAVAPGCTLLAATCAFVTVWVDECNDIPYCTQWYTEVM